MSKKSKYMGETQKCKYTEISCEFKTPFYVLYGIMDGHEVSNTIVYNWLNQVSSINI